MERLSKHFSWAETQVSDSYPDLAIADLLTDTQRQNCLLLARLLLEPIRARFGPTKIHSWVRGPKLNKAVGGVPTSQHCNGSAADFVAGRGDQEDVYNYIVNVLEWPGEVFYYKKRGHIHAALPQLGIIADHAILNK